VSCTKSREDFLNLQSSAVTNFKHFRSTFFYSSNVGKKKHQTIIKTKETPEVATCRTEIETQRNSIALAPRCLPQLHPSCTEAVSSLNSPRFPWQGKLTIRWKTARNTTESSCPTL